MPTPRKKNGVAAPDTHSSAAGLHARIKTLRGDLGVLEKDLIGLLYDVGDAAGEQVQGAMKGAMESARDAADRVESWGSENMPNMRKMVRTKPFAACAMALGAGALLSAILLRR
jgi:ElaB/YqjD/DUF883 family membrane-anchored ribosome-binding protein